MKPLTQTCEALLRKIGRTRNAGVVFLIGVFADSLDDADDSRGAWLRAKLARHARREAYALKSPWRKRSWSRMEWIGAWRQRLRSDVLVYFGRRKPKRLRPYDRYA